MFTGKDFQGKKSLLCLSLLASISASAAVQNPGQTLVVKAKPASSADATKQQATLGNLGKTSVKDTPWSVQTLSAPMMKAQQLKSVNQLYRYMPSVQGDGARPQTRGMQGSVVQNSMIDGLNVVSTTDYPVEQFDHIEVLDGLAGSLYGAANPAGLVNFVAKRGTEIGRASGQESG